MNYDEYFQIALNLDIDDIMSLCRTNRTLSDLCNDRLLFSTKANIDFGVQSSIFNEVEMNPLDRYIQLHTLYQGVTFGSERFLPLEHCYYNALDKNDLRLIKYFYRDNYKVDKCLYHSIIGDNKKLFIHYLKLLYNPAEYLAGLDQINNEQIIERAVLARDNRYILRNALDNAKKYNRIYMAKILEGAYQTISSITDILYLLSDKNSGLKRGKYQGEDLDLMIENLDLNLHF